MTPLRIFELNTPVWLRDLSAQEGRLVTLADIPLSFIQHWAAQGFTAVWLMGVWERSPAARAINQASLVFTEEMRQVLPDFDFERDNLGSAYSIRAYHVPKAYGGNAALQAFRAQLNQHGLKLMLDYVPNHVAPDHVWVMEHPEYFIQGSIKDLERFPHDYLKIGNKIIANGKDPNYPPWSDVLQLNIFSPALRQAVITQLKSIAELCDGVRCDMAMLMMSKYFAQTWGDRAGTPPPTEYWEEIIPAVRRSHPHFIFLAESYWKSERALFRLGFDYCYDKTFFDLVHSRKAHDLRNHLTRTKPYQDKLLRFLENHDESRVASFGTLQQQKTAALILATTPGAKLYHEGQMEGYTVRIPVHLARGPVEPVQTDLQRWYQDLLVLKPGKWNLCETHCLSPAWYTLSTNPLLAWTYGQYVVAINYGAKKVEAEIELPAGRTVTQARIGKVPWQTEPGVLRLTLAPWQGVVFSL